MQGGERVELEHWITMILSGGVFGSAVTYLLGRHRPKVDQAQMILTGSDSLINNLQEERDRLDRRIDAVEQRATRAEKRAAEVESRAIRAEQIAATAQQNAEAALAERDELADQNIALVHYLLDTMSGVIAGHVPPWLPVPIPLQQRITPDDLPVVAIVKAEPED